MNLSPAPGPSCPRSSAARRSLGVGTRPRVVRVCCRGSNGRQRAAASLTGACCRSLPQSYLEPVYFYIYTLFGLQAIYVMALYVTSWLLSGTWLAGLLAACWYVTNR